MAATKYIVDGIEIGDDELKLLKCYTALLGGKRLKFDSMFIRTEDIWGTPTGRFPVKYVYYNKKENQIYGVCDLGDEFDPEDREVEEPIELSILAIKEYKGIYGEEITVNITYIQPSSGRVVITEQVNIQGYDGGENTTIESIAGYLCYNHRVHKDCHMLVSYKGQMKFIDASDRR